MKKATVLVFLTAVISTAVAQKPNERPKLVVGIVVDQMRQEYLYRFSPKFGEGGFKRLMNAGFMMKNAHYNYVPTYTGPGHASIFTGSTPAVHGIIANDWYDKTLKKTVNCVSDDRQTPVGSPNGGLISPWRLLSSTVTDELKLSTQLRAKVVGVSMKDRSAVLPAGHMPDGAYWYDTKNGNFMSSSYYFSELPEWAKKFNALKLSEKYISQTWKTILPIDQYTESGADDSPYETKLKNSKVTFPYNLMELRTGGDYDLVMRTPFGDDLLTDMAKAAIDGESMGKDDITDFLTVSFSCPDVVGHAMGPNSVELEDTYIRLDRNIQDILNELDRKIGVGRYMVFLTADHATAEIPQYLMDHSYPIDQMKGPKLEADIVAFLQKYYPGKKVIESISNDQIFLNQELFTGDPRSGGIDLLIATELITQYLMSYPGIAQVFSESVLRQADYGDKGRKGMVVRGYNHRRSGDIAFVLEPGWFVSEHPTGTTHGSPYTYDTHVPMLFFGAGIKKGSSSVYHTITDIAPTLSVLLGIKFPSGATGQPIVEILD